MTDVTTPAGYRSAQGPDVQNIYDAIAQRCLDASPNQIDQRLVREYEKYGLIRTHVRSNGRKLKKSRQRSIKKTTKHQDRNNLKSETDQRMNKECHTPPVSINKSQPPFEVARSHRQIDVHDYEDVLEKERRMIFKLNRKPLESYEEKLTTVAPCYEENFDYIELPPESNSREINNCDKRATREPYIALESRSQLTEQAGVIVTPQTKQRREACPISDKPIHSLLSNDISDTHSGLYSAQQTGSSKLHSSKTAKLAKTIPPLHKLLYTIMCPTTKIRKPKPYYGRNDLSSCSKMQKLSEHTSKICGPNYFPVEPIQETSPLKEMSTTSKKVITQVPLQNSKLFLEQKELPESKQSATYFSKEIERLAPELIDAVKKSRPMNEKCRDKYVSLLEEQKDITKSVINNAAFPYSHQTIQSVALYQLSDQPESTERSNKRDEEILIPVHTSEQYNPISTETDNINETEPRTSRKEFPTQINTAMNHEVLPDLVRQGNIDSQKQTHFKVSTMYRKPATVHHFTVTKQELAKNAIETATSKTRLDKTGEHIHMPALSQLVAVEKFPNAAAENMTAQVHTRLKNVSLESFMNLGPANTPPTLISDRVPLPTRLPADFQAGTDHINKSSEIIPLSTIKQVNKPSYMALTHNIPAQSNQMRVDGSNILSIQTKERRKVNKPNVPRNDTVSKLETNVAAESSHIKAPKDFKAIADAKKSVMSSSTTDYADTNNNNVMTTNTNKLRPSNSKSEIITLSDQLQPVEIAKLRDDQTLIPDPTPKPTRETVVLQEAIHDKKNIETSQIISSGVTHGTNISNKEEKPSLTDQKSSWWGIFPKGKVTQNTPKQTENRSRSVEKEVSVALAPTVQLKPLKDVSLNELLKKIQKQSRMYNYPNIKNEEDSEPGERPTRRQKRPKYTRSAVNCSESRRECPPPPCPPKPPLCPPPFPIAPPPFCTPMPPPCRSPQGKPSSCPPTPPSPCKPKPSSAPPAPKKDCSPQPCKPPSWCPNKPRVSPSQSKPSCPPPGPSERDPCKKFGSLISETTFKNVSILLEHCTDIHKITSPPVIDDITEPDPVK